MRYGAMAFAVLALALAGCGGQQQAEEDTEAGEPATPAAGTPPPAFVQCMTCHSVEAGRNMLGPSLHGVVGRKAASVPGYSYSAALKASGLTWDEGTLDKWLAGPAKLVPGNKMVFFGQPDAAKRKQVIDYMAAQK